MAPLTTILERGTKKLEELQESARSPAICWMSECFNLGIPFTVAEVYRSQSRQDNLYKLGRSKPGKIVTWTFTSQHTRRLAADIYPVNMQKMSRQEIIDFYDEIDDVAYRYGIARDPELVKRGDLGHYNFHNAKLPSPPILSPQTRLRGLLRRLGSTKDEKTKNAIQKQIDRLKARLK